MLLDLHFELVDVRCDLLAHTVDLLPNKITRREESIKVFVLRVDLLAQTLSDPVLQIGNFCSNQLLRCFRLGKQLVMSHLLESGVKSVYLKLQAVESGRLICSQVITLLGTPSIK
jgi:hypothetical protein